MDPLIKLGRYIFALTMIGFGFQHFIYVTANPDLGPGAPWIVGSVPWACAFGGTLIVTGVSIALGTRILFPAAGLGAVLFIYDAVFYFSAMAVNIRAGLNWTRSSEILAMCGVAFILAGSDEETLSCVWTRFKAGLVNSGLLLFAIAVFIWGILHFMYARLSAKILPSWVPWRLFWAIFVGVAFIAASLAIAFRVQSRLAAVLLGIQFFFIVTVVHAGRVAATPLSGREWTHALVALTMMGASFCVAEASGFPNRRAKRLRQATPVGAT